MLLFQVSAEAINPASKTSLSQDKINGLLVRSQVVKKLKSIEMDLRVQTVELGKSNMLKNVKKSNVSEYKTRHDQILKESMHGKTLNRATVDAALQKIEPGSFENYGPKLFRPTDVVVFEHQVATYLAIADYFKDVLPQGFKLTDAVKPYISERASFVK